MQLSLDSTFAGISKHGRKFSWQGTSSSKENAFNSSNWNAAESLIFLLSAINPGLAMITVSVDADPIFLVGRNIFTESFLSSLLLVSLRLFLLTLWLSEITRTLSISIISFIITSHYLETYLKFIILLGNYDTNKINQNSFLCRVFDNECYLACLYYKAVFKHIYETFFVSLSGLASIVANNYFSLIKRIEQNFVVFSFSIFICILTFCHAISSTSMYSINVKYKNKMSGSHYAHARCFNFNQCFTRSRITPSLLLDRVQVSKRLIIKIHRNILNIICKLIFINHIVQTLVIKS